MPIECSQSWYIVGNIYLLTPKDSSEQVSRECSQSRYIGDIYLHKKAPTNSAFGWFPGYCFEVRAEWLEERESEINFMYNNYSTLWNILQHNIKYQNDKGLKSATEWIRKIAIYLNLPSGSDIPRYILTCRAIAIYGLPINLRYFYKRVSSLLWTLIKYS